MPKRLRRCCTELSWLRFAAAAPARALTPSSWALMTCKAAAPLECCMKSVDMQAGRTRTESIACIQGTTI